MARPITYDHRIQIRIDRQTYLQWQTLARARGFGSLAAWLRQTCEDKAKDDLWVLDIARRKEAARRLPAQMLDEYARCHPRARKQAQG